MPINYLLKNVHVENKMNKKTLLKSFSKNLDDMNKLATYISYLTSETEISSFTITIGISTNHKREVGRVQYLVFRSSTHLRLAFVLFIVLQLLELRFLKL